MKVFHFNCHEHAEGRERERRTTRSRSDMVMSESIKLTSLCARLHRITSHHAFPHPTTLYPHTIAKLDTDSIASSGLMDENLVLWRTLPLNSRTHGFVPSVLMARSWSSTSFLIFRHGGGSSKLLSMRTQCCLLSSTLTSIGRKFGVISVKSCAMSPCPEQKIGIQSYFGYHLPPNKADAAK